MALHDTAQHGTSRHDVQSEGTSSGTTTFVREGKKKKDETKGKAILNLKRTSLKKDTAREHKQPSTYPWVGKPWRIPLVPKKVESPQGSVILL